MSWKKINSFIFVAFIAPATLCFNSTLKAQEFGLEYTGELQTNFRKEHTDEYGIKTPSVNFLNLLRLKFTMPLGKGVSINARTLSAVKTSEQQLVPDLQTYSNIETFENIPIMLEKLDIEWQIDSCNTLYAGVRNMNEDYFTSDVTSFFTNSSCGIVPALSANYPIGNYPYSSVGLHFTHETDKYSIKASLYNAIGYRDFGGRENVFRFCPGDDGVLALAQGEYKHRGSRYFLGGGLHYGDLYYTKEEKEVRPTLWLYGEQKVTERLYLIAGYSHSFNTPELQLLDEEYPLCSDFAGFGAKYNFKKLEVGAFTNYAHFSFDEEWATELTCRIPIAKHLVIQPALHIINNFNGTNAAGLMRFCVDL